MQMKTTLNRLDKKNIYIDYKLWLIMAIILYSIISNTYVFISCFFIHVLKFEFTAHLKGALVDICS